VIWGNLIAGPTPVDLVPDTKRLGYFPLSRESLLAKISACLDGLGPGGSDQAVRGLIYDGAGKLVAHGDSILVPKGLPQTWLDLPFSEHIAQRLERGGYYLSLHAGPTITREPVATARLYGDSSAAAGNLAGGDPYEDGPTAEVGVGVTISGHQPSIFATTSPLWTFPRVDDFLNARYAFPESQAILVGHASRTYHASAAWHGTRFDGERGVFAIVRAYGPLADLVGQRLRIRRGKRSVVCYCHDEGDTAEDISLTRRAFLELAPLATTRLQVRVEVLT
jgi:hypothetical protein